MQGKHHHISNPEIMDNIIPYATYNTHKIERKQTQTQREQAQHTISFLERQAKKSVKELQYKEKSLINFCKLKEQRFEEMKRKQQHRKKAEKQLEDLRQTNTAFRENSIHRRTTMRRQWENMNRHLAKDVKTFRSESERKLSEEKQLERSLLKKRNEAFSRALALGNEHSRIKAYYSKRFMSSQVKNDLIHVQENIKSRELEKITSLNERQQQLLEIVEKTRRGHHQCDNTFTEVKTLPFEQIYPKIKSVKSRKNTSRRNSSRGDSLII